MLSAFPRAGLTGSSISSNRNRAAAGKMFRCVEPVSRRPETRTVFRISRRPRRCGPFCWPRRWRAEFAEKAAGGVDPHGARRHPCRADPVEGCQLLLTFSFDWNGADVAVAPGFEHAFDVGPVGFRTLNVGTYSERRQQFHIVAEAFELASPVMSDLLISPAKSDGSMKSE